MISISRRSFGLVTGVHVLGVQELELEFWISNRGSGKKEGVSVRCGKESAGNKKKGGGF